MSNINKCVHAVDSCGTYYCGLEDHRMRKFNRDIQVTVGLFNFAGVCNKRQNDARYSPINLWTCSACKQYYEAEGLSTCPHYQED